MQNVNQFEFYFISLILVFSLFIHLCVVCRVSIEYRVYHQDINQHEKTPHKIQHLLLHFVVSTLNPFSHTRSYTAKHKKMIVYTNRSEIQFMFRVINVQWIFDFLSFITGLVHVSLIKLNVICNLISCQSLCSFCQSLLFCLLSKYRNTTSRI